MTRRRADFIVSSDDPLTCPDEALSGIVSDTTVVDGTAVHDGGGD